MKDPDDIHQIVALLNKKSNHDSSVSGIPKDLDNTNSDLNDFSEFYQGPSKVKFVPPPNEKTPFPKIEEFN